LSNKNQRGREIKKSISATTIAVDFISVEFFIKSIRMAPTTGTKRVRDNIG
jgi:hypothetical protein